ncbi:hypothetical protein ACFW1M_35350 [Streptomyces inhibens]|uniref:hypothetical protein n=1 Tax=Streptomyces inhibens TaxID=2293571 RepID=UPI0036AA2561
MPSCIHCGARFEDSAATSCRSCGMPREGGVPDGTGQPLGATGYGYVRVGPTILPVWLLWLMAALLAVGGVTAYVLLNSSPEPSQQTVDVVPSTVPPPSPDVDFVPPTDGDSPSAPDTSPSPDDASAIVEEFYQDINDHDFAAAWDLGGKNIGGSSYSEWVAGYDTTASIELSAVNTESPGQGGADLRATQSDGSVRVYQGTYTVSDGVIVGADITLK